VGRKLRRAALGAILLLVVASGVWLLRGRGEREGREPPHAPTMETAASDDRSSAAREVAPSGEVPSDAAPPEASSAAGSIGVFTGRVRWDPGREPAAGLEIVLLHGGWAGPDEAVASTITAADGSFRFDVPAGFYVLSLAATDPFVGLEVSQRYFSVRAGDVLDLGCAWAFRAGAARVRVLAPDGSPAASATVRFRTKVARSMSARAADCDPGAVYSDQHGVAELRGLPPGLLEMDACHPRHLCSSRLSLITREGEWSEAGDLRLAPAGALLVSVKDEEGRNVTEAWIATSPSTRLSKTQPDGSYLIAPIPPGSYDVVIRHAERLTWRSEQVPIPAGEPVRLAAVLSRGLEISGTVVDAAGQPVRGVHVRAAHQDGESDDQGAFCIPGLEPGAYTLTTYEPRFYSTLVPDVAAGSRDVLVVLGAMGTHVSGCLTDERGERLPSVSGCVVVIVEWESGREVNHHSHGSEEFVLAVEPGVPHFFRFVIHDRSPVTIGPFVLGPGEYRDGMEVRLPPGGVVRGRVLSRSTGDPVPYARINAEGLEPPADEIEAAAANYLHAYASSGPDGAFTLEGVEVEPGAAVRLVVSHEDYSPRHETVLVGQDHPVVVRLDAGGVLYGRAPVPVDRQYVVEVEPRSSESEEPDHPVARSAVLADGTYEVRRLRPGEYRACLRAGPYVAREQSTFEVRPFSIGEGERVALDFGAAGSDRVRVCGRVLWEGEPLAGAPVWFELPDGGTVLRETGSAGEFLLAHVPPGRRVVAVGRRGSWDWRFGFSAAIEVPDAEEAAFDIHVPNGSLEVRVVSASDGEPIPHARVIIESENDRQRSWAWGDTDGDGSFRADVLPPGRFTVSVRVTGERQSAGRAVAEVRGDGVDVCEVRVPWGGFGRVRGGVRSAAGRLGQEGRDHLQQDDVTIATAWIRGSGRYASDEVPAGRYRTAAVVPGWAPSVVDGVEVREGEGAPVDFVVTPGGALDVRAARADGSAAAGIALRLVAGSPGVFVPSDEDVQEPVHTACDGSASVEHLMPGRYIVQAMDGTSRRVLAEAAVEVREGERCAVSLVLP
jgi:hypothetical protein